MSDERDVHGNYENLYTSSAERYAAGGSLYDKRYEEEYKINQYRAQQTKDWLDSLNAKPSSEPWSTSTGPMTTFSTRQLLKFWGVVLVLLTIAGTIINTEAWWRSLPSPVKVYDDYVTERIATSRQERYSDFSTLSDWPASIQQLAKKHDKKSLEEMMVLVTDNWSKLPRQKRHELGAGLWFKIAAGGSKAHDEVWAIKERHDKVRMLSVASLTIAFLGDSCKAGIEAACLDAAKVLAGQTFFEMDGSDETQALIDVSALKQLPAAGPIAQSPAIVALRKKISDGE